MKLEQHIYTRNKTEFMTVAATQGISPNEKLFLEEHSRYVLPESLHDDADVVTPVKYVWYSLNKDRFVVGRALCLGRNRFEGAENYLFHNVVISKEDFWVFFQFNPIRVISWLEKKGLFKSHTPKRSARVVEMSSQELRKQLSFQNSVTSPNNLSREFLSYVLDACVHYDTVRQPLLIIGAEQECLDFLNWLFTILPYSIRQSLRFDTYAYGVDLGFQIVGLPEGKEFQQEQSSSLLLHLKDFQYSASIATPEPVKYHSFIIDMVATERLDELNAVYSLEYCLKRKNFAIFRQEYNLLSSELQQAVWIFHKNDILNHIVSTLDTELLSVMQKHLAVEDFDTLYISPELIFCLVKQDDKSLLQLVADWLHSEGSKIAFYPYLFQSPALWKVFLQSFQQSPNNFTPLLASVRALQDYYSQDFEEVLLDEMLGLFPYITTKKRLTKEFLKAFDSLPLSFDGQLIQHNVSLYVLRIFVKYELSEDSDLLNFLIDSDFSLLSEHQQKIVLDSLLENILTLKSLRLWNPIKVEIRLRKLFRNALENKDVLFRLFTSIREIQLSNEARKVLKKVFSDLLEELTKDSTFHQVKYQIDQILKPSSSYLLDKLAEKIFSLNDFNLRG